MKQLTDIVLATISPNSTEIYAEGGRPSIARRNACCGRFLSLPVFDPLGRALIQHIDFNMMYRWFVGLSLDEPIWDHSTFSANRDRLLKESIMRRFFDGVLGIAGGPIWCRTSTSAWTIAAARMGLTKFMAARDGSMSRGAGSGRNPEGRLPGQKRTKTHVSRTDPWRCWRPRRRRGLPELHPHALGRTERLGGRCPLTQATSTAGQEAARDAQAPCRTRR